MESLENPLPDNIIDFEKAKRVIRKTKPAKQKPPIFNEAEVTSFENAAKIKEYERQLKELKEKIEDDKKRRDEVDIKYTLAVYSKDAETRKDTKVLYNQLDYLNQNITRLKGIVYDIERDLRTLKELKN